MTSTSCNWHCQMRKDMWLAGYREARTPTNDGPTLRWTKARQEEAEQAFYRWRHQHEGKK